MAKVADIKNESFGVEIECIGTDRVKIARKLAAFFETEYIYTIDDIFEISDKEQRIWKIVWDSSLCNDTNDIGAEVVTPVLYSDDIPLLKDVVDIIKATGAVTDSSCGLHVHVGGNGLKCRELKNIINLVYTRQNILENSLQINSSRINRYCRKFTNAFVKAFNSASCCSELEDVWYQFLGNGDRREIHYNDSRYHLVNLHSFFNGYGTIEFRLFNGTVDATVICAYVQFCLALVSLARQQSKTSTKLIVSDNEKFTMRNWLRCLGLNGDIYKNCRIVFLKNLVGNTQYR